MELKGVVILFPLAILPKKLKVHLTKKLGEQRCDLCELCPDTLKKAEGVTKSYFWLGPRVDVSEEGALGAVFLPLPSTLNPK